MICKAINSIAYYKTIKNNLVTAGVHSLHVVVGCFFAFPFHKSDERHGTTMPMSIPAAKDGHIPAIIGFFIIRLLNTETRTDTIIALGIPPLRVFGRDDVPTFTTTTLPDVAGKIMWPINMPKIYPTTPPPRAVITDINILCFDSHPLIAPAAIPAKRDAVRKTAANSITLSPGCNPVSFIYLPNDEITDA